MRLETTRRKLLKGTAGLGALAGSQASALKPQVSAPGLCCSESGLVVPTMCEELTRYRRARKRLMLPSEAVSKEATLYMFVRRYAGYSKPLHVVVNGTNTDYGAGAGQEYLHWAAIPLRPGLLVPGANTIDLWTDSLEQTAWTLGIEGGHASPGSFLSTDAGLRWQNERMGLGHVQRGEYVIRVRSQSTAASTPPPLSWEDPRNPRLAELRSLVPKELLSIANRWQRARAIASWVSRLWPYTNGADAAFYTPWDPFTMPAWKEGVRAHGQAGKSIRMCVHYSVFFVCVCLACGIPARCVAATEDLGGFNGHFVSEVWNEEFTQWSMIDPNLDLVFLDGNRPLGAHEVYGYRLASREMAKLGPGTEFQRPRLASFLEPYLQKAGCLRLTSIWHRNDFLSRPDLTPPAHGNQAYCETGFVWRNRNVKPGELGMFPYVAEDSYFTAAPPQVWLR